MFIYFNKGILPWQNLKAKNIKEKYEKIKEKKILTQIEALCQGLPEEFAQYCNYSRKLKFVEKPDYTFLKNLFKNLFQASKYEYDFMYDWSKKDKESKIM